MKLFRLMLAAPLLATLAMLPSCSTMSGARQDLNEMSESEYHALGTKVLGITAVTSRRVAIDWDEAKIAKARGVIAKGMALVDANDAEQWSKLDATSLVRALAIKYGEALDLDRKAQLDIQDAALLVDVIVGPIQLGVDGKLGERERGLLMALLQGLEIGLRR